MTPAERLRAAATRLRELAQQATPGQWSWTDPGGQVKSALVAGSWPSHRMILPSAGGDVYPSAADAEYIATMQPAVAMALADWLDHYAYRCQNDEKALALVPHPDEDEKFINYFYGHALAVADAILNTPETK